MSQSAMMTFDDMMKRAQIDKGKVRLAKTIRITDKPFDDDAECGQFTPGPRVFAVMDDGAAVELTMITAISWSIDVTSGDMPSATITFVGVQLDAKADQANVLPLELLPVEPNGESTGFGCKHREDGDGMESELLSMPTYPDNPNAKALRAIRNAMALSLRRAADLLGLSVVDFSSLERGAKTLSDEQWRWALERVAKGGAR